MPAYRNMGTYLLVEINEAYSLKVFLAMIHEIAERCEEQKLDRVLVDGRAVDANPGIVDRFQIGLEIAKTWGSRLKVTSVAKPRAVNRMAETTAANRGSRVFATSRMEDALDWLGVGGNDGKLEE